MIIESKRATNENVINQGLFYLDGLAKQAATNDLPLFGSSAPTVLIGEPKNLDSLILQIARDRLARQELVKRAVERLSREQGLGMVSTGDLKRRLTELRDRKLLCTDPASGAMKDDTVVYVASWADGT